MQPFDAIRNFFDRRNSVLWNNIFGSSFCSWGISALPFADAIWLSMVNKITSLCNDVTFELKKGDVSVFADFKAFFEKWGQVILNKLYDDGFCVIGYKAAFRILRDDEFTIQSTSIGAEVVKPKDEKIKIYVLRSWSYMMKHKSEKQISRPFLQFFDNVMNSSNTISERLGSLVVMSPESQTGLPTPTVLTEEQKKQLEKETTEQYGSLSKQKQLMVMPRTVRTQVINLAGVDQRTVEKVKMTVCAIADIIGLPANQAAIIDANSSKSLANGTELLEGDYSKYQAFERRLQVFVEMAKAADLDVDYTIYNKPVRQAVTAQI